MEWCIINIKTLNIQVLNLSLGAEPQESYRTDPLCRATTEAWKNGIVVCCAAGNEGPKPGSITTPGINPHVITVGNIDDQNTISSDDDRLHWSSSKGPTLDYIVKPDLVAPGTEITSLANNKNGYRTLTGTSMATGFVSGSVALILQQWKDYSPDAIKRLLLNNTKDLGLGPNLQGAGELNLEPIFRGKRNRFGESQREMLTKVLGENLVRMLSNTTNLKASELGKDLDRIIYNTITNLISKNH
ncbi:MAG TPA: S8 family serine peptidase [Bacillota bacterium]|nr:S8 family serine peptidase [Bacillota bacterium]HOL10919.1 S8 family serine peptidase [Bacillota bacterium]HPO98710.1 S8 family serine peptidase [Bacillota bacterium]